MLEYLLWEQERLQQDIHYTSASRCRGRCGGENKKLRKVQKSIRWRVVKQ